MSGPQPMGSVRGDIFGDSDGYELRLVTPWLLRFGGTSLRTSLDLRQVDARFSGMVYWRTADVDTAWPNAWNAGGTARTAAGGYLESFSVASGNPMWVQAAVFTRFTSKGAPANASARLWAAMAATGWVAGVEKIGLEEGGASQTIAVGAPFACAGVTHLLFGMVYTGVSGTITSPTPCWRGFTTGDTSNPGAWTALTAGSSVTSDGRVLGSLESATTTAYQLIQAGYRYTSTGTTTGTVDVIVAAKN